MEAVQPPNNGLQQPYYIEELDKLDNIDFYFPVLMFSANFNVDRPNPW
jgi:hypothetical protein